MCRYSLYISGGFKWGFKFPISASGFQGFLRRVCPSFWLYNEQLSCCLLVLDHFYCTNTSLTCTGRYTQLQFLVQTKPVIAQDVTLTWANTFAYFKMYFDITLMPKCNFFMCRRNATFWSKVGKMGVGEMGVGEQGPIRLDRCYKDSSLLFWLGTLPSLSLSMWTWTSFT